MLFGSPKIIRSCKSLILENGQHWSHYVFDSLKRSLSHSIQESGCIGGTVCFDSQRIGS